jgi:hypothetical protein
LASDVADPSRVIDSLIIPLELMTVVSRVPNYGEDRAWAQQSLTQYSFVCPPRC